MIIIIRFNEKHILKNVYCIIIKGKSINAVIEEQS